MRHVENFSDFPCGEVLFGYIIETLKICKKTSMTYTPNPNNTSQQSLLDEVVRRSREEGVTSQVEYDALIDELLQEKDSQGAMGPDEDTEQLRADLVMRWTEVQRSLDQ